ncbi:MAG: hypothetical protein IJ702_06340 [Fretibacterium sp.]|nr:hypothetical protein [Fretibacterium sp.]
MELKNIEGLVDHLSEAVEKLIQERDGLKKEIERLTAYAAERDEECVRVRQEMAQILESAAEENQRMDRSSSEIEAKLQNLNDRLMSLVTSPSEEPPAEQG